MKNSLTIKIALAVLIAVTLIGVSIRFTKTPDVSTIPSPDQSSSNTKEPSEAPNEFDPFAPSQQDERGVANVTVPPPVKQRGSVKGQNSPVKFVNDLETSLKVQELPQIWLEFTDENDSVIKVDIQTPAKKSISSRWNRTLELCFMNSTASDYDTRLMIQRYNIRNAAVTGQELSKLVINTPYEKRQMSEDEAFDAVALIAKLAIERFGELKKMASETKPG